MRMCAKELKSVFLTTFRDGEKYERQKNTLHGAETAEARCGGG